ncbi:MAG: hypothetical protein JWR86_1115 [Enterovirga sp.]|nr:hypothetical protein [Enterovirga sp.]
MLKALIRAALAAMFLSGAGGMAAANVPEKALVPIPAATLALMRARDTDPGAPILMRAFKKEGEIELWKMSRSGRYVLLKTYPICRWSGQLGPKQKTGDRQTPEGFYSVSPGQMNPNSSFHLSFDLGYPNAYDRAHGGTGSYLMVHGTCSSAGCFAMTDEQISEIYAVAREAFAGGQRAFQFHSFPFRLTAQNMARARSEKHIGFWRELKEGYDRFEAAGEDLAIGVTGKRYSFGPSRSPAREALVQARRAQESEKTAALVADGIAAVRVTYEDGGMHAAFASLSRRGVHVGAVSRPETLALAGREIVVTPARPKPVLAALPVQQLGFGPASGGLRAVFAPALLARPIQLRPGAAPASMAGASPILPASGFRPVLTAVALRGA